MGRRAVVAAAHPLAAEAGIAALRAGGNAVDAAIAANAALAVVRPGSCGIGGDLFALVFDPRDQKVHFVNGSGRSPGAATSAAYRDLGLHEVPANGPLAVTVPGCVDGWAHLHRRFGKVPWRTVFDPAISLAGDGYPISAPTHRSLSRAAASGGYPEAWHAAYAQHLPDRPGDTYRIPQLAGTLRAISEGGPEALYDGDIAGTMVSAVQEAGGFLAAEDLADHTTTSEPPLHIEHSGHTFYQTPPNSQGVVTLVALQVLERLRERAGPALNGDPTGRRIHLQVAAYLEGLKLRDRLVADPAFMPVSAESLIDAEACRHLADRVDLHRAASGAEPADRAGDTTALAVADADGWMVILIQSLYHWMGSRVTVPGWGIVLQSRAAGFRLDERHPNGLGPRKRPLHTLSASLVCKDGRPLIGFATEGGHLQPQVHVQVLSHMLDADMDVQAAIEQPRWCYDAPSGRLRLENRFPDGALEFLRGLGYDVHVEGPYSGMGQAHGVQVLPSGVSAGGADPRSEGYVLWL